MSIDEKCRNQQSLADRIFMDFKYTKPGSKEQICALASFNSLVCLWADFLLKDEKTRLEPVKIFVKS